MNFNNSEEIINNDLEYICRNLQIEVSSLEKKTANNRRSWFFRLLPYKICYALE